MTNCPAAHAAELLAVPVLSDNDVVERVAAVIDQEARRRRTLWLFFLERDGTQADVVEPVDGLPDRPSAAAVGHVCYVASESIAQAPVLVSVIITLTRTGALQRTDADRHMLRALQHGASRYATPVRMLCLATPEGVRELGPVRPTRLGDLARCRPGRARPDASAASLVDTLGNQVLTDSEITARMRSPMTDSSRLGQRHVG